jgi:hypothetical protein
METNIPELDALIAEAEAAIIPPEMEELIRKHYPLMAKTRKVAEFTEFLNKRFDRNMAPGTVSKYYNNHLREQA